MIELARFCADNLSRARAIVVSSVPYHDAGAHAVQELGWTLATALHYLRRLTGAGLEPATAASQMAFRLAVGRDLFLEIAKLRALRLLWHTVLVACGVLAPPRPWLHVVTSSRCLTRLDPWVNILRGTTATFAAIAGEADCITTACFDAEVGRPDPLGSRLARNTQHILAAESHLGEVIDPGGGSYYLEWLTERLAGESWQVLQTVERRGGMAESLLASEVQVEVERSWRTRCERLDRRIDAVTGISEFADPSQQPLQREDRRPQRDRLLRGLRSRAEGPAAEVPLQVGAEGPVARGLAVALAGGWLAEIGATLQRGDAAGKLPALARRRDSSRFENLREAADRLAAAGNRPAVVVVELGTGRVVRARSRYASNFYKAGGFDIYRTVLGLADGDLSSDANQRSALATGGAAAACLTGSDEAYARLGREAVGELERIGVRCVNVVGSAERVGEFFDQAKVDHFIDLGCNAFAILSSQLRVLGAKLENPE
jgi:methylmalonyl-CoA mutase